VHLVGFCYKNSWGLNQRLQEYETAFKWAVTFGGWGRGPVASFRNSWADQWLSVSQECHYSVQLAGVLFVRLCSFILEFWKKVGIVSVFIAQRNFWSSTSITDLMLYRLESLKSAIYKCLKLSENRSKPTWRK